MCPTEDSLHTTPNKSLCILEASKMQSFILLLLLQLRCFLYVEFGVYQICQKVDCQSVCLIFLKQSNLLCIQTQFQRLMAGCAPSLPSCFHVAKTIYSSHHQVGGKLTA